MKDWIKRLCDKAVLQEVAALYDKDHEDLSFIGGFENLIYEFEYHGAPHVLRLSHSSQRTRLQIQGEVEWMLHLAASGVSLSRPVSSLAGRFPEIAEVANGSFLAVAFRKASGRSPSTADWKPELFEEWGRLTGRMHSATVRYRPTSESIRRMDWKENEDYQLGVSDVPAIEDKHVARYQEIIDEINALPTNEDDYGLIHSDLHHGNFFVHQGKMTAFDFDDAVYQHFIQDIAIPLFYGMSHKSVQDTDAFAHLFLRHFLKGYREFYELDQKWLPHIPLFLDLRRYVLYGALHRRAEENDEGGAISKYRDRLKLELDSNYPQWHLDFKRI